jgi:hypothetical protein
VLSKSGSTPYGITTHRHTGYITHFMLDHIVVLLFK